MARSHYVHGTAAEEQARLSRLNAWINERALAELALAGGERVLDVGSGLGQFTRAMARAAGRRVLGVERDAQQLAEAQRKASEAGEEALVEFRAGDALELPLAEGEWGSFDVAHARFLLEHVPDPLAVVRAMVRAVRPGGRVVLADDDHDVMRLWPEVPGLEPVWRAYMRMYERAGNDPIVGRRLVQLLAQAGARPVRNTWVFFGGCAGDPQFATVVANLAGILEGARAELERELARDELDRVLDELSTWGRRDDAAFWFAIAWAEGVKS